jgi:hypothetical protein
VGWNSVPKKQKSSKTMMILLMFLNPLSTLHWSLNLYSISIALTIEPEAENSNEYILSPLRRLRALQTVRGYFLPDPITPNRLTVWFTGGQLRHVPPPEDENGIPDNNYGGLDEWKALFGAEHKKTWGESLSNFGAQLFLGAELPAGMEPDGSMAYTLHRPFGGHGKGYVDVSISSRVA